MKRLPFWLLMCLLSVANGVIFFRLTAAVMARGIPDVDNQAALLMIPFFWIAAAAALVLLNIATLVDGRHIPKDTGVDPLAALLFAGLSGRAMAGRVAFLAAAVLLVYFALHFDHRARLLSAAYAATGGVLLILLYGWWSAAMKSR